ncbi:hypothetical protein [Pareuzebyella sediminis]|uniref:hypothetical protein n=1 Tax=Pareuzebyella sediminis TaxID=2607998 RepID=UPI0011ED9AF8|nr:hypothetical protein [Pareuzebyella sediminis]
MFPSIVLPFGSNKAKVQDITHLSINAIYGYTKDGSLKELDKSEFLQNIRVGYFDNLYNKRFGLRASNPTTFKTNRLGITINLQSKISEQDKERTKEWIREKLSNQGCVDSMLILKKKEIVIPKNGQYYESNNLVHDTIISLY